jgi:hypothetical protein
MDFFIPLINTIALAGLLIVLMVGLVSAPWQVLLLLLIAGLFGIERLKNLRPPAAIAAPDLPSTDVENSLASQCSPESQPIQEKIQDVVFVYRGSTYKPASSETSDLAEVSGKYRGQVWRHSTSDETVVS